MFIHVLNVFATQATNKYSDNKVQRLNRLLILYTCYNLTVCKNMHFFISDF